MAIDGRATGEEIVAGLDLSDKTIVVTGTSAGLGRETARVLAMAGAEVVMVARDVEKNETAAAWIRDTRPEARLRLVTMDLADLDSVRKAADQIVRDHPRIAALINNAGVMGGPLRRTADGLEWHWGVNHIGPFLFTNLLVPALKSAAPSRIVMLTSAGHRLPGFDLADVHFANRPYTYHEAYCQSKRANVLNAVALARRLAGAGVTVNAAHPGAIRTEVFRHLTAADADTAIGWSAASGSPEKTPSQGAATAIWAALSPEAAQITGKYLEDCRIGDVIPEGDFGATGVVPAALDEAIAEELWRISEETVGQTFSFG